MAGFEEEAGASTNAIEPPKKTKPQKRQSNLKSAKLHQKQTAGKNNQKKRERYIYIIINYYNKFLCI